MLRLLIMLVSSIIILMMTYLASVAGGGEALDWLKLMRDRGWVTAFLEFSKTNEVISRAERIVALVGADRRLIYEMGEADVSLSLPAVSRNGAVVFFAKVEKDGTALREYVYMGPIATTQLKRVFELRVPAGVVRGAALRTTLAVSHDGERLAFVARAPGDPATPVPRLGDTEAEFLRVLDVRTGEVTVLGRFGRRTRGPDGVHSIWGHVVTRQAWAPDNRRLVFMNDDGQLVIVDVATRETTMLGLGTEPTWSPDGQWIAARIQRDGALEEADYVIIAATPPHTRTIALRHRSSRPTFTTFFRGREWFGGPALWSPDGQYLIVTRVRGESEQPSVIERSTSVIYRISPGFELTSLGAKP